jgi:hypothetical protein
MIDRLPVLDSSVPESGANFSDRYTDPLIDVNLRLNCSKIDENCVSWLVMPYVEPQLMLQAS